MVHFRVPLILVVCVVLCTTGAAAQESDAPGENGTVHGYIVDTTPAPGAFSFTYLLYMCEYFLRDRV